MSTAADLANAQAQLAAVQVELGNARSAAAYGIEGINVRYRSVDELLRLERYWRNEVARLTNGGRGRIWRPVLK